MWISEAAEAAGVNVETVRYYERRGYSSSHDGQSPGTGSTRPRSSALCGSSSRHRTSASRSRRSTS